MFRLIILFVLFVCGVIFGFCYFIDYFPLKENNNNNNNNTNNKISYMGISYSNDSLQIKTNKTRIPFFKNGILKTEVIAKELLWKVNKPILMKEVRVKEYSEDGVQIIARMSGDFGEMYISEEKGFERLKIWGNTKIIKYSLKK